MKNNGLIIYMIGWMIYETVDLVWHVGGMTYRGSKYIYDWYYEIPTPDEIEINKLKFLEDKVVHLEKLLEKKLIKK